MALSLDLGYVNVEEEVSCAVRSAAGVLEELGAEVTEADPPFDDPVQTFDALWSVGVAKAVQTFPADVVASMDPGLLALAEAGAGVSGVDYAAGFSIASRHWHRRSTRFSPWWTCW